MSAEWLGGMAVESWQKACVRTRGIRKHPGMGPSLVRLVVYSIHVFNWI